MQLSFALDAAPEGLVYRPDFITLDEERALLSALAEVEYHAVVMHGQAAKRTVAHFGVGYGHASWSLDQAPPLPTWVQPLLPRVAEAMGQALPAVAELLVSRYPTGAGIGWHRDAPLFGPTVAGLSLGGDCRLLLRHRPSSARSPGVSGDSYALTLAPRSLYLLGGAARTRWQHRIPAVAAPRWSLSFRTVVPGARPTRAELRRRGHGGG